MSISEQIETIITSMTDNNYPPQLVTITKAYNERICDITTNTGEVMKRVRCSNLAVEDTIALLTYPDGDPNKPFVLLFTDELNPCNFEVLNEELVIDFCGEARKGGNTPSTGVDIVTSWSVSPADDRVPSEKLTKNSLDDKSDVGHSHTMGMITGLETALNGKQDTLVSGTNIKTINNNSLLGSGNITIEGGGTGVDIVTSWNSTPTDTSVPSEKLTKDTLDLKLDSSDAFSGDYEDLNNKPTIPSKITDLTNDSDFIEKSSTNGLVKNDGTIDTTNYSTFDGNYNSLTNKPTIPSKTSDLTNDGDGTNVFVKNNDSRLTDARTPTTHTHTKSDINDFPTIPSKLSDLTNDSDFIEKSNTSGLIKNDGTVDTTQYLSSLPSHNHDDRYYTESEVDTALGGKQATLVSGTNIKTINNQSLLGSGNITIQGGGSASNIFDLDPTSQYGDTVVEEGVDKDGTGLGYGNDILIYNSQESKFYYDKNGNADNDVGNELATMNDIPTPSLSVSTGVDTSNEVLYIDITLN